MLSDILSDPDNVSAIAAVAGVFIALFSVVIAAASIWLSLRAISTQDRHNKLSVLPIPYIKIGDFSDHIFVNVKNSGSGPLILKSIIVSGYGNETKDLISRMPDLPSGIFWNNYSSRLENHSILPNEEITLIDISGNIYQDIFVVFREKCRKTLAKLCIVVEYEDIYGQKFVPVCRKLDWFARGNT